MLFKAKRAQGESGTASLIRVHLCSSVVKEKAEPKIAGRFRLIRKHAGNGIRLCHGGDSVTLCTHSPINDDEPKKGAINHCSSR